MKVFGFSNKDSNPPLEIIVESETDLAMVLSAAQIYVQTEMSDSERKTKLDHDIQFALDDLNS